MKRHLIRWVAGANVVAGCLMLQGCGMFGKKQADAGATELPDGSLAPVEVTPVEPVTPVVAAAPVELPVVASTTPYTIQKGDTISGIAYKYSLRWQDVVAVNPGIVPTRLRVGQMIQLPGQVDLSKARPVPVAKPRVSAPKTAAPKTAAPAAAGPAATYTVKSGDSLSVIAQRHGVKTAAIREANSLKGDKIIVGQKLKIPGAKASVASAEPKKAAAAPKVEAPKVEAPKPPVVESKPVEVTAPPAVEPPAPAPAPAPAEPPAPAEDPNVQTYEVKEGEDLYAVAIRWGVSPSDLKALNNLTSTELKAGTKLKIPGGVQ